MNTTKISPEDRLLVELTFGIDLSYVTYQEYGSMVSGKLPDEFLYMCQYKDVRTGLRYTIKRGHRFDTTEFKEILISDLLDYKEWKQAGY